VCFDFAADRGLLARIGDELSTADLIAEPWSITSYQMGEFAAPWGEWNDQFRDTIRRHQNKLGIDPVTPGDLALRLGGSPDRFADDGRQPWHSVNFVVAHDGFTLHDLFACNEKQNDQPWPLGPSPGGSDNNISWDQGGDPALQRQAARTAMALLLLAPGVPMITGVQPRLGGQLARLGGGRGSRGGGVHRLHRGASGAAPGDAGAPPRGLSGDPVADRRRRPGRRGLPGERRQPLPRLGARVGPSLGRLQRQRPGHRRFAAGAARRC
jgi:hypothetical protein